MLLFARRWLKDPMKVGAVAPSSPVLARAMVKALDLEPGQTCLEIGPGTGAFTEHLIGPAMARSGWCWSSAIRRLSAISGGGFAMPR